MNNFKKISDRIKKVRNLFEYSQMQMAKQLDIPQPSYARYETGLTQKIPYSILNSISIHFGISIDWLNNGDVDVDLCKNIADHIRLNNVEIKRICKTLDLSESFFNAVLSCEVSPSKEFYEKVMRQIGFADVPIFAKSPLKKETENIEDKTTYLKYRIEKLQQEISEKEDFIDKLFMENERLKIEIEQLRNEQHKGR